MILPIIKNCTSKKEECRIPEALTYSYFCDLSRLGGEAFSSFVGGAEEAGEGFAEFYFDSSLEERDEIFRISVLADKIRIGFRDARGAVNGAATAALLLRKKRVECCEIVDYPDCAVRSFLLDMSRGQPTLEQIKNIIYYLALAKYNRLHLHLMDFRGLCYRSEALPEFVYMPPAEEKKGNSYVQYEKSQMREIIELCDRYAIEIIPEIEIPAHATALCAAHPEFRCQVENAHSWTICPGNDDIWAFFDKLVGEVVELFPKSEYIHIGSDELEFSDLPEGKKRLCHWDECPRCAALREREGLADRQAEFYYLVDKMHGIVKSYGKKMIMWNDQIDISGDVPISRDIVLQFWRIAHPGRGPYEGCIFNDYLKKGFKVINAYYPYTYLDIEKYMSSEKMKSWTPYNAPEQSPEYASQILGGEVCAWETGNCADYPFYCYTLPPSIALAGDKMWTRGERELDDEYKKALSEFIFGSAELAPVFECIGDVIPPRSGEIVTYVSPEDLKTELIDEMINKLQDRGNDFAARAYAELLERIKEAEV